MKPEPKITARRAVMDFTRGVLDRIRDHMDEMDKEKEAEDNIKE